MTLRWTLSNSSICFVKWGDHTAVAYSRCGHTSPLKIKFINLWGLLSKKSKIIMYSVNSKQKIENLWSAYLGKSMSYQLSLELLFVTCRRSVIFLQDQIKVCWFPHLKHVCNMNATTVINGWWKTRNSTFPNYRRLLSKKNKSMIHRV